MGLDQNPLSVWSPTRGRRRDAPEPRRAVSPCVNGPRCLLLNLLDGLSVISFLKSIPAAWPLLSRRPAE